MKLAIWSLLAGSVLLWSPPNLHSEETPLRLRVLSYNIHHGEGTDGRLDLQRQADVIARAKPDLVALQEVDDRTQRTGVVDQTAELAKLAGMHGRFVHQIDFQGGRYGQAILSRVPIPEPKVHWLPGDPAREQRVAGAVIVEIEGRRLIFVGTHLNHLDEANRVEQAEKLNALFGEEPAVIMAGDLNAVPDSKPMAVLYGKWGSATDREGMLTFPAPKPNRQLDYVLFRPAERFRVISAQVIKEPVASDHRPLLVELEFR